MFNSFKRFFTKLVAPVVSVLSSVKNYICGLFSGDKESTGSDEEPDPKPVKEIFKPAIVETDAASAIKEPLTPVKEVIAKLTEKVASIKVEEPTPETVIEPEPVVETPVEEPKPVKKPENPFSVSKEEFQDMEAGNQANYTQEKRQAYLSIKQMLATKAKRKAIADDIARGIKPQIQYGRGKFFIETPDGLVEWTDFKEPPRQEIKTIADMYIKDGTKMTATPHLYGYAAAHKAARDNGTLPVGNVCKKEMIRQRQQGANVGNNDALGHLKAVAGSLGMDVSAVNEFADFTIEQLDGLMLTGKDSITAFVKRIRDAKMLTV